MCIRDRAIHAGIIHNFMETICSTLCCISREVCRVLKMGGWESTPPMAVSDWRFPMRNGSTIIFREGQKWSFIRKDILYAENEQYD